MSRIYNNILGVLGVTLVMSLGAVLYQKGYNAGRLQGLSQEISSIRREKEIENKTNLEALEARLQEERENLKRKYEPQSKQD